MRPRHGLTKVVLVGLLVAGSGLGCDWISVVGDPDLPTPTSPHTPTTDAAMAPDGPAVLPDGSDAGYEAMCRRYCQALQETDVLACTSTGRQLDDCKAVTSSTVDVCFDQRCRPHRVSLDLCFSQCDSLARLYDGRCPVSPSSDPLCPLSPAEHDAACRAGCVL